MQMKKRPKQEDFFTRDKEEAATETLGSHACALSVSL